MLARYWHFRSICNDGPVGAFEGSVANFGVLSSGRTEPRYVKYHRLYDWISGSLLSSFDVPNAPLGRPRRVPLALAAITPSCVRSAIRSRSISAKRPKRMSRAFVCQVCLPSKRIASLIAMRRPPFCPRESMRCRICPRLRLQAREFADDQAVTGRQGCDERQHMGALGGLSG
jgi:hypothetical protein